MKELTQESIEHALASAESARYALARAVEFTDRHAALAGSSQVAREVELLKLQFPSCLQPPQADDHFVGRILYPMAGFSPEAMGMGYYCSSQFLRLWSKDPRSTMEEKATCARLEAYWEANSTTAKVRAAYPPELARTLPSDAWTEDSGVAFPLYRIGGTTLNYERLLYAGLARLAPTGNSEFAKASRDAIHIVRECIAHYAFHPNVTADQRATLTAIHDAPPRTLKEAIQLLWIYALVSGTWNFGRLDVVLGPYLHRDFSSGILDEAAALDLLCSLWRLIHAYTNQYNNRIIIGGQGRPDEEAADRIALLAIEATRRVRLNTPQLTLRFHKGQNPMLWTRALDAIGEGCTFPMLYNDDINIPAVAAAFDVDLDTAATYVPYGCGEYVLGSMGINSPNGVINLLKALEVALHGGTDPLTGTRLLDLPAPDAITTFEELWQSYDAVVAHFTQALARQQKVEYDIAGQDAGFLLLSLLLEDCSAKELPALGGGVRFLGGAVETYGNTNTADSLHAINELVFQSRQVSLPDFVAAMDADFAGWDVLRNSCVAVSKYGNDEGTADAMAARVHDHICQVARKQAQAAGLHSYLVVMINNWANTVLGRKTGASADGRPATLPMANGNNPSPGSDISGVTAFLNSIVKLNPSLHAGAVQNMKFGKEWFGPLRPKFDALLRTYFHSGGTQAMITVVSKADLEAALQNPAEWGHLMVRVGGFSIRFIDLPRDAQLEVLSRTLH